MDPKITQEILDDLIPSLESLETRSTAVLEFLKSEGIATDEKLAPYFEKAATASNVRWLGVRVRIERLLTAAEKESADKKADEDKKSADSGSPGNQVERKAQKVEKISAKAGAAEAEPEEKSTSSGPQHSPQHSEDNRTKSKEKDKGESSESPQEQAAKVANPLANNAGQGDRGGNSQSAPAENPSPQKVA